MKIRIKSNGLRYRLTRSDVSTLAQTGWLKDSVNLGGQTLIYAISATADDELSVLFTDNTIKLLMPGNMISELAGTDRVGFESDNGSLNLLVEKDFTCLDNVAEDQSDNYPNPLAEKV